MYPETQVQLAFTEVDTHDLKSIAIADISFYPPNYTIVNPTYQIFPPNFNSVSLIYTQSAMNVFNSNTLNITCVDDLAYLSTLPDGIWRIKQTVSPAISHTNDKSFIRVASLKHQFELAFLKTDMINCGAQVGSQAMSYLSQIEAYIEGAIAAANQCNNALAMQLYRLAESTLKNYIKENCAAIPTKTSWY